MIDPSPFPYISVLIFGVIGLALGWRLGYLWGFKDGRQQNRIVGMSIGNKNAVVGSYKDKDVIYDADGNVSITATFNEEFREVITGQLKGKKV
jgi:hypothetical protein